MVTSQSVLVAANRFGLGMMPGDSARISDPKQWLLSQLSNSGMLRLEDLETAAVRLVKFEQFRAQQKVFQAAQAAQQPVTTPAVPGIERPGALFVNDLEARARHMVGSNVPFLEHLTLFWTNLFTVSTGRDGLASMAVPYENEAIRPYVTGRFTDMLLATAFHPAMLHYLDNQKSIGPDSLAGLRSKRSYNENFAREVMELHTLGVDGGYSQDDIIQLALALTGWSVDPEVGEAMFRPNIHEPGPRTVLGQQFPDAGENQAKFILRFLAGHPKTARHVCSQLASYFLGTGFSPRLLSAMTAAWADSHGSLPAVYKAMLDSPDAWVASPRRLRSPEEFVLAAARAYGLGARAPRILKYLRALGDLPFSASSPAGQEETDAHWLTPGAMLERVNIAADMGALAPRDQDPRELAAELCGVAAGSHTDDVIRRAASAQDAFALLLLSPEFQRI